MALPGVQRDLTKEDREALARHAVVIAYGKLSRLMMAETLDLDAIALATGCLKTAGDILAGILPATKEAA